MHVAYEVTFICYSPFSLDIFPRNVQNKPIKFKQFLEKLYHETVPILEGCFYAEWVTAA